MSKHKDREELTTPQKTVWAITLLIYEKCLSMWIFIFFIYCTGMPHFLDPSWHKMDWREVKNCPIMGTGLKPQHPDVPTARHLRSTVWKIMAYKCKHMLLFKCPFSVRVLLISGSQCHITCCPYYSRMALWLIILGVKMAQLSLDLWK